MADAPICPVCDEEVVAVICPRPGPMSDKSAAAIRELLVAAHRRIAGHERPARIRRRRRRGWRMPAGAIYVGRPTRWGNPYEVGRDGTRAQVVALFRERIVGTLDISELTGKDLACWCPLDGPCHADVLLEVANGPSSIPQGAYTPR